MRRSFFALSALVSVVSVASVARVAGADDLLVPRPPRLAPPARPLASTDDSDALALDPAPSPQGGRRPVPGPR
jgi:hypothetical protein